ncbi:MAG: glutamate-cysteine ligase family protein [Rhodothermales bacterium]
MPPRYPLGLFDAFGVELEYMIVDRDTLAVKPVADELIRSVTGSYRSDVENGAIGWSNELVNHVIELKTNGPAPSLTGLADAFHANVLQVNARLAGLNAMLLPTGAHPLMDPYTETVLWPHEFSEVYQLYNRIFDCRGHGWSNLQSTHLNLPFADEAEFGRLHAAIRLVLPIIPALTASSPLLDGAYTGFADSRLETYRHNQELIPAIAGKVIPEPVFTEADYRARIYEPIRQGIEPYDTQGILKYTFINSRGAIARFDRGAIEIRVIDIQECPAADIAILAGVVAVLRALVDERWVDYPAQQAWGEEALSGIFLEVVRSGEDAVITDPRYLEALGVPPKPTRAGEVWGLLIEAVGEALDTDTRSVLRYIVDHGTLTSRIRRSIGASPVSDTIRVTYRQLAACLAENRLFGL